MQNADPDSLPHEEHEEVEESLRRYFELALEITEAETDKSAEK